MTKDVTKDPKIKAIQVDFARMNWMLRLFRRLEKPEQKYMVERLTSEMKARRK